MRFHGMNPDDARAFAEKWLPAWSGNRPELLVSFYSLDAVYSDPAIPEGVRGHDALLAYFTNSEIEVTPNGEDINVTIPNGILSVPGP